MQLFHFIIAVLVILSFLVPALKKKNTVNGNEIEGTLVEHYARLLGLENKYDICPDMIRDAFELKMEMLGNVAGETAYVNDLEAARMYLLDAYKFAAALN